MNGMSPEGKWIDHWRSLTYLRNREVFVAGLRTHTESTRQILSRIGKGRPKPAGFGAKVSAALKGRTPDWSEEGRKNVQSSQFKKGRKNTQSHSDATSARLKKKWAAIPPEQRSLASTERNLNAWKKRSKDERSAIARKILATRVASHTPEELSEICRKNATSAVTNEPNFKDRMSRQVKGWWASISPEERAAFIARRQILINAAKAAKKAARQAHAQ